ncbi:hypothetical protein O3M35_010000 [Rhynocoris fuscipes]|uniref:Uncharacterized protein n=1 Tax=Rhynocoris fuscipes TaxID=488301 RepID=A0AAW1D2T8_9HEMI
MFYENIFLLGGRGRGRLVPQEVLDAPLRKPVSLFTDKTSVNDKLARLDILFTGPLEDLVVYRVLDVFLFREGCSELDIEKMMDHIFKNTLTDASNANYICKYLYVMFRHTEKGSSIRTHFYKYLEKYFKESSTIKRDRGPVEYRNFVTLFAAAAHHARNINFAPFDELIDGLLTLALNLAPSSLQEDIQVFSLCVIRYSQYLTMRKPDGTGVNNFLERDHRLEDAKKVARKILLTYDITKKAVAWLVLAIECKNITNELLEQFSPPLEKLTLSQLKTEGLRIRLPKNDFTRYSLTDVSTIIELV